MNLPYLTTDLPGIGGQLKTEPEDFFVEEIPLYSPAGQGQHVYVEIEKRGLSTYVAIKMIARALNISPGDIGHAGLKDAQAVTRQTLSIDRVTPEAVATLNIPHIKILRVNRHYNKLKIGHLAGNRFVIRVRQVAPEVLPRAEAIVATLVQKGVPNFFGEQRFGHRENTHLLGETLVRRDEAEFVAQYLGRPQPHEAPHIQAARQLIDEGRWNEALAHWPSNLPDERRVLAAILKAGGLSEAAFDALEAKLKSFFVSAFQSQLFNELLVSRLDTLDRLENGDVAYIHGRGAAFVVVDAAVEQPRADRFEISPSGPLFGPKTLMAEGEPGQRERAVLAAKGLTLEDFKVPGLKLEGARRPFRINLKQAKIEWDEGLLISFELQPGAYATTVMAEIMKNNDRERASP
ncbi:MAG: tRNA pseudouridine(13) synthase TruD [Anaerolineae bacterium]|nr:tRNA pseudouridine(13) synthase TruD [Anaerolineae bacterium]